MSQDEKDHGEGFLSRWSQRKQEAKLPAAEDTAAKPAEQEAKASPAPVAETDAEAEFDLSSLPKLEDLTETTDITGFLRKGVPESLRNAALRKSWALDPAIRNYVNPALDYAYDWNTPGGVPGNSEIAAGTDIAKMVLQIMGSDSMKSASQEASAPSQTDATGTPGVEAEIGASQNPETDLPSDPLRLSDSKLPLPRSADAEQAELAPPVESTREADVTEPSASQQEVRRHGTAKPRV